MTVAVWTGLGLGFLVAAQVGPIWLLCARSVLRGRLVTGLAIGAGAALVDLAYAGLGVAGAAQLLRVVALRLALGLVGTAVLLGLGARTLWSAVRVRAGGETQAELASPLGALGVSLAATASNPLTIASWAAVFAAASAASVATSPATTAAMLAGIGVGSFAWFRSCRWAWRRCARASASGACARPTRWPAWACSALAACSAGAPSAPLERDSSGLDSQRSRFISQLGTAMCLPRLTTPVP